MVLSSIEITGSNFPVSDSEAIKLYLFGAEITPVAITASKITFNSPIISNIQALTNLEPLTLKYLKSGVLKHSFIIDNFSVDGVVYDTETNMFLKCNQSCKKCSSTTTCQVCQTNYIRIENDNTICYSTSLEMPFNEKYYYRNEDIYSL